MLKLLILVATTVFGYAFWLGAEALGFDFIGSFLISGLGSMLGVWVAWKFHRHFHD
ncbi:hypothetical protein [Nibricoccus aquaticus]|uniref:hypothetical protein n=1 Tax=Nibricoccus aquaticus TaxID=2576891 RepID=UPI00158662D9|nr:hypothetical protein [Nibricoccus aquaticus]